MNNNELEFLNQILYEYVYNEDFLIEDYTMLKKLNDFAIKKTPIIKDPTYTKQMRIQHSYELSINFLSTIDKNYADYLEYRWKMGIFDFQFYKGTKSENKGIAETYYDEKHKTNRIYLPVKENIEDSFSITHEIIHDMNLSDKSSFSFYILCEALSILSEFLEEDYLKRFGYNDFEKNKKDIFYAINFKTQIIDFELYLLNKYVEKGEINNYDIRTYLLHKNGVQRYYAELGLDNILISNSLSLDVEQRNIIGIFISSYMHDRILQNKKNINEFIEINNDLNNMDLYDIFKFLELDIYDYESGDLTNSSYKKLFKSYTNELKRMG